MTFHWANHSFLWSPCRDSDVPIGTPLVIIQAAPFVMENMVSLFNPSCVKIFTWKICFLHLAIVVTQLSNLSCPGNTTAMNTLLSREESIGVPVTFHRLQRKGGGAHYTKYTVMNKIPPLPFITHHSPEWNQQLRNWSYSLSNCKIFFFWFFICIF